MNLSFESLETPALTKFSLSDLPIMTIGANGKMDEATFYDLIDKKIAPIWKYQFQIGFRIFQFLKVCYLFFCFEQS